MAMLGGEKVSLLRKKCILNGFQAIPNLRRAVPSGPRGGVAGWGADLCSTRSLEDLKCDST
ncbi:hypothetical protein U1701_05120 [Sphingomonas sp. PB2P19]|uniref:hypothetical protein n=1 Tax=Sphingomonas rhamnosi TaxID=3096156 RepID=UPI002FCB390D